MSVTFSVESVDSDIVGITIICADQVRRDTRTWNRSQYNLEVVPAFEAHMITCESEECRDYRPTIAHITISEISDAPEINVSNSNARLLLEALGLDSKTDDLSGSSSADGLMGRVLMALAVAPVDDGVPSWTWNAGEGQAVFVDCGRSPGYLQDRLLQIKDLVEYASKVNRQVVWC